MEKKTIAQYRSRKQALPFGLLLFLLMAVGLHAQAYLWPTTASHYMSSSFCEYRPAHYHSAIDIKTWNREGYPVFAVDDGRIFKIRISPFGYGKVLYLQLKDGHYAVYAHLKKFVPAIEKAIHDLQLKEKRYSVTWQPDNWPVKRGQLLAYTGQTGIGVPHLHFEIRDARQHPLNPLAFYRKIIKDNTAPILQELLVIPLTPNSLVNGSHLPRIIPLYKQTDHRYGLCDSLSAHGIIGLALRSYDRADGVYNKFAFYQTEVFWDGENVFKVSYDTLDFSKTRLADVELYYPFKVLLHKRFRKLFIEPFNTLPFYGQSPGNGFLKMGKRNHRFRLIVRDFFGNESTVEGIVRNELTFTPRVSLVKKTGQYVFLETTLPADIQYLRFRVSKDNRHWRPVHYYEILENGFTTRGIRSYVIKADMGDSNETHLQMEFGREGQKSRLCPISLNKVQHKTRLPLQWHNLGKRFVAIADTFGCCADLKAFLTVNDTKTELAPFVDAQHLELALPVPEKENGTLHLEVKCFEKSLFDTTVSFNVLFPQRQQTFAFFHNQVILQAPRQTVYDTLIFTLSTIDTLPKIKGVPLSGPILAFGWYPQIFRKAATLLFKVDSAFAPWHNMGVAALNSRGRIRWIGGKIDSIKKTIAVQIKTLHRYVLCADTVAPLLKIEKPAPFARLRSLREIRLALDDTLSGIGTDRHINIFIDSLFVVPEWDPERKLVTAHPDRVLSPGLHKIRVSVKDMAGNRTEKSLLFTIINKKGKVNDSHRR